MATRLHGARWLALGLALAMLPATASRAEAPKQVAHHLFERATIAYKLGRFEEALVLYSKAYEAFPLPALLFNIGQCHKMLKNHERAIFFFRGFLQDKPDDKSRPIVESLIAESQAELDKGPGVVPPPSAPSP